MQWIELFAGHELIVIAIANQDGEVALNHRDLLYELERLCQTSGVCCLHVHISQTQRWEEHANPQVWDWIPFELEGSLPIHKSCVR